MNAPKQPWVCKAEDLEPYVKVWDKIKKPIEPKWLKPFRYEYEKTHGAHTMTTTRTFLTKQVARLYVENRALRKANEKLTKQAKGNK